MWIVLSAYADNSEPLPRMLRALLFDYQRVEILEENKGVCVQKKPDYVPFKSLGVKCCPNEDKEKQDVVEVHFTQPAHYKQQENWILYVHQAKVYELRKC